MPVEPTITRQNVSDFSAKVQEPFGERGSVLPPVQAIVGGVSHQHRDLAEGASPVSVQEVRRAAEGIV